MMGIKCPSISSLNIPSKINSLVMGHSEQPLRVGLPVILQMQTFLPKNVLGLYA
jgi:hypothetical protein